MLTTTGSSAHNATIRHAGGEPLSLALMASRNRTLSLFALFEPLLREQGVGAAAVAPALWRLGRAGWFQEWWVARNLQRARGVAADSRATRLASIEPRADACWASGSEDAAEAAGVRWPGIDDIKAYLLQTLEATLELLAHAAEDDAGLYFYRLALLHEDLLHEQWIEAAQTLGVALPREWRDALQAVARAPRDALLLPATRFMLGSGSPGFAFDHERPAHGVDVPEFEIDAQAVTWAQYAEFVADGGYDREECWSGDGWAWLRAHGERRAPRHVEQIGSGSGAALVTRFGVPVRMAPQHAALHVSWWEADAWCRWAGRRLPAEVEWELAAVTAARRGFHWGDVWEWTASRGRVYPGFEPGPASAGMTRADAGRDIIGNKLTRVLRGASFATTGRLRCPRYRAFAPPERDEGFVGFRSCV